MGSVLVVVVYFLRLFYTKEKINENPFLHTLPKTQQWYPPFSSRGIGICPIQSVSLFFLHPGGLYQETYIRVKRHNPQRSRNRKHVENREESVTSVPPEVLGSIGVEFYLVSQTPKDRQDLSRTSAGPRRTVIFLQGRVKDQR